MSRPRLLFVVESPFSERDRRRFGLDQLSAAFDVTVIDATPIVSPSIWLRLGGTQVVDERVTTVTTHGDLVEVLVGLHFDAVVSILGVHEQRHAVYDAARRRGAPTIELLLGVLPGDDSIHSSRWRRLTVRIKQTAHPRQLTSILRGKIQRRRFVHDVPDMVVFGGLAARRRVSTNVRRLVEAHSLDYELYVHARGASTEPSPTPIAVYLDQDIGFHADYEHAGLRSPVEPNHYYPELLDFLGRFEAETGTRVVIAPHPRAEPERLAARFPGFEISSDPTVEIVRRSSCVLAHVSTAVSFAVLWGKPIYFLGGAQIMGSWYAPYVSSLAAKLNRPIVDTSLRDRSVRWKDHSAINLDAYADFVREYLSSRADDGRRLWDIVTASLLDELDRRP